MESRLFTPFKGLVHNASHVIDGDFTATIIDYTPLKGDLSTMNLSDALRETYGGLGGLIFAQTPEKQKELQEKNMRIILPFYIERGCLANKLAQGSFVVLDNLNAYQVKVYENQQHVYSFTVSVTGKNPVLPPQSTSPILRVILGGLAKPDQE